ncbi:MAG: hypothetical protein EAX95_05270 [Candidatus Thorarchaeota archaeon]|nr:hypothetical protein [Candidatus Thorarchaeota archaeon]
MNDVGPASTNIDVSKIRHVMIMGTEGGELLLYVPYAGAEPVNPDMHAALLRAVLHLSKDDLRAIRWKNSIYIFETATHAIALIGMTSVDDEAVYRAKLMRILQKFEIEFDEVVRSGVGDIRRFKDFALTIIEEFPLANLNLDMIPKSLDSGETIPWRTAEVDFKLELIEQSSNGERTLRDIARLVGINDREAIALASILLYYGWMTMG